LTPTRLAPLPAALDEHNIVPAERDAQKKFLAEGEPLMKQLEAEVQERLWSSEKSD
jgi:hypothetical protein